MFKRKKRQNEKTKFVHAKFDNGIQVIASRISHYGRWEVNVTDNGLPVLSLRGNDRVWQSELDAMLSVYEAMPAHYDRIALYY